MFGTLLEKELERKTIRFKEDLTYLSKLESSNIEKREKTFESIKLVESLGFTNSEIVKQSRELISKNESFTSAIRIASESLLFMKNLIDYFGEGIILVKKEDFINLIKKYDLVCGDFSDYLGVIPDENLQRISECRKKLMNISTNSCPDGFSNLYINATNLYKLTSVITYSLSGDLKFSTTRILNKFPFMVNTRGNYNSTALRSFLGTYLNIPESEIRKINDCSCDRVMNGMFIAAPRKEMKNAKKGISFRIQPDDPFICGLSKYGVVIYSRWGKEASDKTFKKYEDLFARLK